MKLTVHQKINLRTRFSRMKQKNMLPYYGFGSSSENDILMDVSSEYRKTK